MLCASVFCCLQRKQTLFVNIHCTFGVDIEFGLDACSSVSRYLVLFFFSDPNYTSQLFKDNVSKMNGEKMQTSGALRFNL
jgi:hypothetical protein